MFEDNRGPQELTERRIFSRLNVYLPVKFKTALLANRGQAYCMNISAGGVKIITDEPVMADSAMELWVNVPNSELPFYTKGKIVWVKEDRNNLYSAGISFNEPNLIMLNTLVEKKE